jgi:oligopeptidase A
MDANPLFDCGRPPAFDRITVAHVEPAIRTLVERTAAGLAELERNVAPTFAATADALATLTEPLGFAWGVVNHLNGVRNGPELRAAHQAVQPLVVDCFLAVAQSAPLYRALRQLRDGPGWNGLDPVQQRIVACQIRDAELAGVALGGAARERFQAIERELAELATAFSNRVLDATKAFALVLCDPAEVDGLPASARAQAAAAAQRAGQAGASAEAGPWRITLDGPSFGPFMEHARRGDLREQLYRAFVTRASAGELDNQPAIARLLLLRAEKARLLGFATFAEYSLAAKMAPSVAAVDRLVEDLRAAARPRAEAELAELGAYASAHGGPATLALWDVGFWAERLREERYAYTDEQVRPYFALPRVLDGLFAVAGRAFAVQVRPADGEVPVWHPDVRFFRIADRDGRDLAAFYLDPYSRPADKRGGAWMDVCLDRNGARNPIAYLVCNQTPPVGDTPSLMTFREVETLFHEFGHGLQHMLTAVGHPLAAGINNVEWDAVELPSQFMENWCYDRATVLGREGRPGLARHYQSGEAMPAELFARICAARTYRAGAVTLRQLYFATLDLELHHRALPGEPALAVQQRIAARFTVLPPLPEDRFLCGFTHIFAGGYAAGYYSYKWAEVLAADAFAAFTEAGLDDDAAVAATGARFRATVLGQGGSRHPLEVFRDFRGREPSPAALLAQCGLR